MTSKKHYVDVADILHQHVASAGAQERTRVRDIIRSLADVYASDNPRFARDRFYLAAGLTAEGELPIDAQWDEYLARHKDSAYGVAARAFLREELDAFGSDTLDEAAQIARQDATVPAYAAIRVRLEALALKCDSIRTMRPRVG